MKNDEKVTEQLINLADVYMILEENDVLKGTPELEEEMKHVYESSDLENFEVTKTIKQIFNWLESKQIPYYENYFRSEYFRLKMEDLEKVNNILMKANRTFLEEYAKYMEIPFDVSKETDDSLAEYLTFAMVYNKDYDYYSKIVRERYEYMLEEALKAYKVYYYDSIETDF